MSRRRYTEEFKVEAVRQVTVEDHSVPEVAKRLGVTAKSLYEWKRLYGGSPVRTAQAIGATLEGTLRDHMIVQNDFVRDSVYFSITAQDWPQVKQHLQARLARRAAP